jgi:hypothetical protein
MACTAESEKKAGDCGTLNKYTVCSRFAGVKSVVIKVDKQGDEKRSRWVKEEEQNKARGGRGREMLKRRKSALVHGDEIFSTSAAAAVGTFTRREISSAHPFDHPTGKVQHGVSVYPSSREEKNTGARDEMRQEAMRQKFSSLAAHALNGKKHLEPAVAAVSN